MPKETKQEKRQPRQTQTRNKVLIVAAIACIALFVSETLLLVFRGAGYSDTFIISFYTAWTVELWQLAGIRKEKIRCTAYNSSENEEDIAG